VAGSPSFGLRATWKQRRPDSPRFYIGVERLGDRVLQPAVLHANHTRRLRCDLDLVGDQDDRVAAVCGEALQQGRWSALPPRPTDARS
jgi:hypothetical protein